MPDQWADTRTADLQAMSPDEIDTARRAGGLDDLLGHVEQLTKADIRKMNAAEVLQAHRRGAFESLLGRAPEKPADTSEVAPAASRASADQGARGHRHRYGTREELAHLSSAEIVRRHRAGLLDDLLGRTG